MFMENSPVCAPSAGEKTANYNDESYGIFESDSGDHLWNMSSVNSSKLQCVQYLEESDMT